MSNQTNIEWADSTFNPWMGCTKVSPACDNCYAERDTRRFGRVEWGAGKPRVRTSAANWKLPERWNKAAFVQCPACDWRGDWAEADRRNGCCPACNHLPERFISARRRVFCASLADWLDNEVPIEWLVDLLDLIRRTPNLDWLLLTKRIGNLRPRLKSVHEHLWAIRSPNNALRGWVVDWHAGEAPANVWLGATVVNQAEADRDVPKLLEVPARVRFLSIEPMLGDIRLGSWLQFSPSAAFLAGKVTAEMPAWTRIGSTRLDWIIAGGESGPHARPMHPDWLRSLRDQCAAAGVAFLFKQWGQWGHDGRIPMLVSIHERSHFLTVDGRHYQGPSQSCPKSTAAMLWLGKKAAGRMLDGRTHDGFPAGQP